MRYIIIGAGAVGGAIGGLLHEAGSDVVLVARGAHYEALRADGLRLTTPDGTRTLQIPVVDGPEALELRADDVLLVAVKTQDAGPVLDAWSVRPVAGGGTAGERLPVVCAQNGVEGERLAQRRFDRVYGMCVWLFGTHLEPGQIVAEGFPYTGVLHIGRYPSGTDETAERIAADLEKAPIKAPVEAQVMRWKYAKLLGNLGNAVEAICGSDEKNVTGLWKLAVGEGREVLTAAGVETVSDQATAVIREELVRLHPSFGAGRGGGSSWQSLTRGTGSIEADYLNGEIALLGHLHGVPTPVNDTLRRVANEFAREGRQPGTMTVGELTARIKR